MTELDLCKAAIETMGQSYSPYSGFRVGAALLTEDGTVYTGCNVENASFSATVCAERTAIFKAVSEGKRSFAMLAVAGGKQGVLDGATPPCGVCRQVLSEFCKEDFPILLVTDEENYQRCTLGELLPQSFLGSHL